MAPALTLHVLLPPSHPCTTVEAALRAQGPRVREVELQAGAPRRRDGGDLRRGQPHRARHCSSTASPCTARARSSSGSSSWRPSRPSTRSRRGARGRALGRRGAAGPRPPASVGRAALPARGAGHVRRRRAARPGRAPTSRSASSAPPGSTTGSPPSGSPRTSPGCRRSSTTSTRSSPRASIGGEQPNAADLQIGATIRVLLTVGDLQALISAERRGARPASSSPTSPAASLQAPIQRAGSSYDSSQLGSGRRSHSRTSSRSKSASAPASAAHGKSSRATASRSHSGATWRCSASSGSVRRARIGPHCRPGARACDARCVHQPQQEDDAARRAGAPKDEAAGVPAVAYAMKLSLEQMGGAYRAHAARGSTRATASTAMAARGPIRTGTGTRPSSARTAPRPSPRRRRRDAGRPGLLRRAHASPTWPAQTEYWLGQQGRLTHPMVHAPRRDALRADRLGRRVRADRRRAARRSTSPDEAIFYTSGRTSATRPRSSTSSSSARFGTNNLPDCSNMCHESTRLGADRDDRHRQGQRQPRGLPRRRPDRHHRPEPRHQPPADAHRAREGQANGAQDRRDQPAAARPA